MSDTVSRIVLVEDHVSFRQALATMLEREPEFHVVGQAGSVEEALGLLSQADVAVVDLGLPDGEGTEIVAELQRVNTSSVALVLTASLEPEESARAIEAGAAGVLHKSTSIEEIVDALRRLSTGEILLSVNEVIEMVNLARTSREQERQAKESTKQLTNREREIIQALGEGLSSKEIAHRLYINIETERSHMANILAKLGLHSRMQVLLFAIQHGLVKVG